MSTWITRFLASLTQQVNSILAFFSVLSYIIGWGNQYLFTAPPMLTTVAYASLVIYWRFWYVFALPAFFLGQAVEAPRRDQLITVLSVIVIMLIKFLYGYQLPD